MKLADLHSHTKYSFDSQTEPEALVLSAIDKGLDVIAITDHADILRIAVCRLSLAVRKERQSCSV